MIIIPSPIAPIVVQVLVGSVVVGWLTARTADLLRRSWLGSAMVLPFLLPPILLYNMLPLRTTILLYIEIAILFRLLLKLRPELLTNRYREFVLLTVAIVVVAFWRSENLLYLLIPYAAVSLRIFRRDPGSSRRALATALVIAAGFSGAMAGVNVVLANSKYLMTATMNPLSVMLAGNLGGPHLEANLAAIDRSTSPSSGSTRTRWTSRRCGRAKARFSATGTERMPVRSSGRTSHSSERTRECSSRPGCRPSSRRIRWAASRRPRSEAKR
ncbi:hypothetical protein Lxx01680 [Leifsonia xyli subsp. xyli str. CTCB07]|uniref:Uncharacterized protein n=2 Tax=Leifsonia xyli subsp. xyli TaxID=59736 RepID=Q6AHB2_LEIXX|nr:hypothetical protein Lxx01680 [Leifsonia xyli subsp. xyli str. CTCB07]